MNRFMWCVELVARVYGLEMIDLCRQPAAADTKRLAEARTLLFALLAAYDCTPARVRQYWDWPEEVVARAFAGADQRLPYKCHDRVAGWAIWEAINVGRLTSKSGEIDFTGIPRKQKIKHLRAQLEERRDKGKVMQNAHFADWYGKRKLYGSSADVLHANMHLLPDFRGQSANPDNDVFIREAFEIFAMPAPWGKHDVVFLVEKYALAFGFNRPARQGFETDGRVVLMCGRSSVSHRPSAHCLVFKTVAEADAFCGRIPEAGKISTVRRQIVLS
jgi:hypothetical protein